MIVGFRMAMYAENKSFKDFLAQFTTDTISSNKREPKIDKNKIDLIQNLLSGKIK